MGILVLLAAQGIGLGSGVGTNPVTMHAGDAPTTCPTVTIQCNAGVWVSSNGVHLIIPPSLGLAWDTSVTSVTVNNFGVKGVLSSTGVTYTNGNKTAIITISTSFQAGDRSTIDGLRFDPSNATPSTGNIYGDPNNTNSLTYLDFNTQAITIVSNPSFSSSSQTLTPPGPVAATAMTIQDGGTPGIWSAFGIRIIIPAGAHLHMGHDHPETERRVYLLRNRQRQPRT